ncbi:MAG: MFS transporter, partial [Verrucomicrobia bacterium]|nr:MFS transporter [Verrucomicrobiota bacterium]
MPADSQPLSPAHVAWRWRILISTYLAYVAYYFTRKVFGLIKVSLNQEFGWSLHSIAHIWTAFLIAYMVGQFVCGFVGRKWGPRVLLLGGLAISIFSNCVFGLTNSYATFLAFMVFNGLAQAAGWPGSVGAVAPWLRRLERGRIMGVWSTSYIVGNIAVKAIGSTLLGLWGWRWSYFGCTILSALIWGFVYWWQRNRPEDVGLTPIVEPDGTDTRTVRAPESDRVTAREYLRLALNPVILAMGVSYFAIKFLRYALDSWLPTILALMGLSQA